MTAEPTPAALMGGQAPTVVDADSFASATGASNQQMADLESFRALLGEVNQHMNLVGPSALAEFWPRHAWDSAQLLRHAPDALTWADLGAGAGFPGVVLAILLKEREGARVHLIESVAKRCGFLRRVAAELALPVTVHNSRAEYLSLAVDRVTARACAPLPRLLHFARPYLQRRAVGLFLKGRDVQRELTEAAKLWSYSFELRPSASDSSGRILVVTGAPQPHDR